MELNEFTKQKPGEQGMFGPVYLPEDPDAERGTLERRFGVPPFSVLDARQGYWQERKRHWIALGIKGEEGRTEEHEAIPGGAGENSARRAIPNYEKSAKERDIGMQRTGPNSPYRTNGYKDAGRCFGEDLMKGENPNFVNVAKQKGYSFASSENEQLDEKTQRALSAYAATNGAVQQRGEGGVSGTSVFDPVLCEMMYKWFAPPNGRILDPFAGESTKGIIAAYLGYDYTGIELRPEQIKANYKQANLVADKVKNTLNETFVTPTWLQGDSSKLSEILAEASPFEDFDFIWTSPPYYDLEIYSQSEKDGSAFETYERFMSWYHDIFKQAVSRLKNNRFLAVKVGEIRDEKGFYRNFERDNISCFESLGLHHYNRIVLVTAVGSLPVRVGKQFGKYRKIGATHQMVYVFWKGDNPKLIPQELGIISEDSIGDDSKVSK